MTTIDDSPDFTSPIDSSPLRSIIHIASLAVQSLWSNDIHSFWRSTEHRSRAEETTAKTGQSYFPTVTCSATDAILRLVSEAPDAEGDAFRKVVLEVVVPAVISRPIDDLRQTSLREIGGQNNPFTLSLYLALLMRVQSCHLLIADHRNAALERAKEALSLILAHPLLKQDGDLSLEEVHPFILYHVARALKAIRMTPIAGDLDAAAQQLTQKIQDTTRRAAEMLFARGHMDLISPSEAVASVFCTAVLAASERFDDWHYVLPGLEIAFRAQDQSGCWPLGRVVPENKDLNSSRLEISTYEIAWVITDSLRQLVGNRRDRLLEGDASAVLRGLIKAGRYAENSTVVMASAADPRKGWCSDHPYGKPLIESWTSATVLQFALSLQDLIEEANREMVLKEMAHIYPGDEQWPSWLRWVRYRDEGEVDHERPVLRYLESRLINPILESPTKLPSAKNESVSAVLFGPPGTSKTTIVRAVADALGWPLVLLSPGDFISKGLEYIEAQASTIFRRLLGIRRAVILFDECDELFRDRSPSQETEQVRGIAAFVTASMLPKLQELHDRGRVTFFICTNKLESLDPAIRRSGRIDHVIGIGPPDREARLRIASEAKGNTQRAFQKEALEELAASTERFIRAEIQRAVRLLFEDHLWPDESHARRAARKVAEKLKDSLTITVDELEEFKRLAKDFSRPYIEGGP